MLAYALANILASLFSKGFGIPAKGEEDEDNQDKSQDASGTGMGEGVGVKDVSDQITDEDQLLGTSEKVFLMRFGCTFYCELLHFILYI